MINPMVRSAAAELIATQDEAIARYTAESAPGISEPEQRRTATIKAAYQRNLRDGIARVNEWPEDLILVATQPPQSFPVLDALDVTAQLIPRDGSDRDASRRRSALGWAFARESSIATGIIRKDCQSPAGGARATMLVAQRPLRTATPPAASALRLTGSVPDITLAKPTKMAENRITSAVVKAKLRILALGVYRRLRRQAADLRRRAHRAPLKPHRHVAHKRGHALVGLRHELHLGGVGPPWRWRPAAARRRG